MARRGQLGGRGNRGGILKIGQLGARDQQGWGFATMDTEPTFQVRGFSPKKFLHTRKCKGGPQFKSATPQYCGQPNRLRNYGLKKLRNCNCGPLKFDFPAIPLSSFLPIPLLSSPISSAQDAFKNQPKIFLELSVSMETKHLP
jgi:hypothetical protein